MAATKSGNSSELLVFLDQSVGFTGDFFGGNFDFDLSLRACGGFSWTHYLPFGKSSLVIAHEPSFGRTSLVVRQNLSIA